MHYFRVKKFISSGFLSNGDVSGVCMGLAWTSHGGSTLYIETIKQKRRSKPISGEKEETGNGKIEFTGELKLSRIQSQIQCGQIVRFIGLGASF